MIKIVPLILYIYFFIFYTFVFQNLYAKDWFLRALIDLTGRENLEIVRTYKAR